jgi:hypothetical protein
MTVTLFFCDEDTHKFLTSPLTSPFKSQHLTQPTHFFSPLMCGPVGKDLLKIKCDVNAAVSMLRHSVSSRRGWATNQLKSWITILGFMFNMNHTGIMSANFRSQLHTLPRVTFQWVNSLLYLNIAMENDPVVDDLAMKHGQFLRLCGSLRNTQMADCGLAIGCYGSGGSAGDGASAPPTLGGWGSCCVLAAVGASKAASSPWQLWLVLRAVS